MHAECVAKWMYSIDWLTFSSISSCPNILTENTTSLESQQFMLVHLYFQTAVDPYYATKSDLLSTYRVGFSMLLLLSYRNVW